MYKLVAFALAVSGLGVGSPSRANEAEDKAVAFVVKLGGKVTRDDKAPGKPVVTVDLFDTQVTDAGVKELLVLNYDASISLHAVVKGTPEEHRAERLKSVTAEDNRISFGCINVPEAFYATVVSPTFTNTKGIVYVLPETAPASELFGFHGVGATAVSGVQQGPSGLNARSTQAVPARDAR